MSPAGASKRMPAISQWNQWPTRAKGPAVVLALGFRLARAELVADMVMVSSPSLTPSRSGSGVTPWQRERCATAS